MAVNNIYSPWITGERARAHAWLDEQFDKNIPVKMTSALARTTKQNSYLHLCLQYAAVQLGESMDYVKREYYKRWANEDIFLEARYDPLAQDWTTELRSTRDLTQKELELSIAKFNVWCLTVPAEPFSLPDPSNIKEQIEAAKQIEQNKEYI